MRAFAFQRQLLGGALVTLAGTAVACDDSTVTDVPVPVAAVLSEGAGVEAQSGTVATVLATPVTVLYTRSGAPVAGANITWKVQSGGGSVDAATSTTDANGAAIVHWTLGTTAGADTLIATTADSATSIITATAVAGPVANLTAVSGNAQDVAAGAAAAPLVVEAVDQYGNPVAGATVTWSVSGGGTVDNATTTTDGSGKAQVVLTMGATPGTLTVTANVGNLAPVTFTEHDD